MKTNYLYAGSWLDETGRSGGGIRVYRQQQSGGIELVAHYREDLAAGYLCISADKRYLYAVDEIKRKPDRVNTDGAIYAFEINAKDGTLTELNHRSSCGVFPNYLALSSDGSMLFAVNYGSEDVVVRSSRDKEGNFFLENIYEESSMISVAVQADGSLGKICDLQKFEGQPSRFFEWFQAAPHPHCIGLDPTDRMLLVADRGCDELTACTWDPKSGKLGHLHKYKTERGIGPRNCVFHPTLPSVYVVGEVKPYVTCYQCDADRAELKETAQYLTTAEELVFDGEKSFFACAHPSDIKIHPNLKTLYVANRGPDTIACFRISEKDGSLAYLQEVPSGGVFPWSMTADTQGSYLYVGNKDSGSISCFAIDAEGIPQLMEQKGSADRIVCLKSIQLETADDA